ncbi:MAG: DUF6056 family protein [Bacteroidota bacterium]|nr:DUF6056 family protein [Bacteroidota bacterium]
MKTFKKISNVKFEILLTVLLILMILPFIILHFFNHPTAEELFYVDLQKRYGSLNSQLYLYNEFGGRYLTNFLIVFHPLIFKSFVGYKIYSLFLMLAMLYVIYLFISEFTASSLTFREKFLFSLSVFFLYLFTMPSLSQGFYLLESAICYHIGLILILVFAILYNRLSKTENSYSRIFYIFFCCLTIIAILGINELAAAIIIMLLFFLLVEGFFQKKIKWLLILFLTIALVSVYIVFTAPGTTKRFGLHSANQNIFNTFYNYNILTSIAENSFWWIINSPLLPFTILLIPIFFKIIQNRKIKPDIFSIYSVVVCFSFVFACTFLIVWSTGEYPLERILNFVYFLFLFGWFCSVIVFISFIKKRYKINIKNLPLYVYVITFIIIAFFLVRKHNAVQTAYSDLLNGSAINYDAKLNERYKYILQNESKICEVDSLENTPKTLLVYDISSDPISQNNFWYARYFHKKKIYLKKPDEQNP